jgi:uncharacterized membrane protein YqhA
MRTVFTGARYIVLIAVIGLLLCALAVFVFGGIVTVTTIVEAFASGEFNAEGARFFSVELIELIDLFLLGTVLFITSLGLYELFVDPSIGPQLPAWLSVRNLDQLKFNLVAVLVVMLLILFLGSAAAVESFDDGQGMEMLALGGGIALVIAAAGAAVVMLGYVAARIEAKTEAEHEARGHEERERRAEPTADYE